MTAHVCMFPVPAGRRPGVPMTSGARRFSNPGVRGMCSHMRRRAALMPAMLAQTQVRRLTRAPLRLAHRAPDDRERSASEYEFRPLMLWPTGISTVTGTQQHPPDAAGNRSHSIVGGRSIRDRTVTAYGKERPFRSADASRRFQTDHRNCFRCRWHEACYLSRISASV